MGYRLEMSKKPRNRNWVVTVKGQINDEAVKEMGEWCLDSETGRRMSYDQFHFRTKEEAVVFFLKWTS